MNKELKRNFAINLLGVQEKKIEIHKVVVNDITIEVTIDETTNTLDVYCWDYDVRYTYRWCPFASDKNFRKFVGQPWDLQYFLDKLRIKKDEFNLTKSKQELYTWSIHHFKKRLTREERAEWLHRVNQLDDNILAEEGNGDIDWWVYI